MEADLFPADAHGSRRDDHDALPAGETLVGAGNESITGSLYMPQQVREAPF